MAGSGSVRRTGIATRFTVRYGGAGWRGKRSERPPRGADQDASGATSVRPAPAASPLDPPGGDDDERN